MADSGVAGAISPCEARAPILILAQAYAKCARKIQLKHTPDEAKLAQEAYGGEMVAQIWCDLTLRAFDAELQGRMVLHLCCHNDAKLGEEFVAAFVNDAGELELVSIEEICLYVRCTSCRGTGAPPHLRSACSHHGPPG